jgi:hypothetical protein
MVALRAHLNGSPLARAGRRGSLRVGIEIRADIIRFQSLGLVPPWFCPIEV